MTDKPWMRKIEIKERPILKRIGLATQLEESVFDRFSEICAEADISRSRALEVLVKQLVNEVKPLSVERPYSSAPTEHELEVVGKWVSERPPNGTNADDWFEDFDQWCDENGEGIVINESTFDWIVREKLKRADGAKKTKKVLKEKKARGELTGAAPYGMREAENGMLEPCPEEQATIRMLVNWRAGGLTFRGMVEESRKANLISRRGQPLSKGSIENILKQQKPS